jgi:hypothetical protein
MIFDIFAALILSQSDALSSTTVEGLSLKAPGQWNKTVADGTSEWAKGEDARLALSVFAVDPPRMGKPCVDQMLEKLGAEGFEPTKIGKDVAAKKISSDVVGEGDAQIKVTSTTVVGCNGNTKWLLTWTARTDSAVTFGPLLKRILDSISYSKKPASPVRAGESEGATNDTGKKK